jgi:hypothetical protein
MSGDLEGGFGRGRSLLFFATEDWFLRSHFLPMIEEAAAQGFAVTALARMGDAAAAVEAAGARLIDLGLPRGENGPAALARAVARVRSVVAAERPDILHAISLKPIMLALAAQGAHPRCRLLLLLTGLGFLQTASSPQARLARAAAASLIRRAVRSRRAHLAVENLENWRQIEGRGPALNPAQATLLPGAGVALERFPQHPDPGGTGVRVGLAARLVRSKGVDVAVAAVRRLRAAGLDVTLDVAGAPDPENPAAVTLSTLADWASDGAADLHGHVVDISAFWADRHIACLPSLGGEGLPRSLLEAAASARPIVTTKVGGCEEFVRDGETGFLVPPGDPVSLAAAIDKLARDPALRTRLGLAGRRTVEAGYTIAHVRAAIAGAWSATLGQPALKAGLPGALVSP